MFSNDYSCYCRNLYLLTLLDCILVIFFAFLSHQENLLRLNLLQVDYACTKQGACYQNKLQFPNYEKIWQGFKLLFLC